MSDPKIEIYIKDWCGYSQRAVARLDELGAEYDLIDVTHDPDREAEMIARSGRTSVPEIFVDGTLIGGSDDLEELRATGKLRAVLGLEAPRRPHAARAA